MYANHKDYFNGGINIHMNAKSLNLGYGYIRVSTTKQEAEGYSLEAQTDSIKAFCKARGIELKGVFTDALSGKRADRPELNEALRMCKLQGATLIVAKIDRLTRDLHFLTSLQKEKVNFLAVDMPEANSTMLQIMVSFAEFENEMRSQRVKAGMQKAKEKGRVFGTPSNLTKYYEELENEIDPEGRRFELRKLEGTHKGKKMKVEDLQLLEKLKSIRAVCGVQAKQEKAKARAEMLRQDVEECKAQGLTSMRAIAECLTGKGIPTPSGKLVWNVGNVQSLFKQLDRNS